MKWVETVQVNNLEFRMRKTSDGLAFFVEYRTLVGVWQYFGTFKTVSAMRSAQMGAK